MTVSELEIQRHPDWGHQQSSKDPLFFGENMRYPIPDGVHHWARKHCTNEAFNGTTLLKQGTGQYVGYIAEAVFGIWLGENEFPFIHIGQESFDADFQIENLTFDVKAKNRSVLPLPHYAAHVLHSQKTQKTLYYVFSSVLMVKDRAACCDLMGWIRKDQFWAQAEEVKQGTEYENGMRERAPASTIPYSALNSMDSLANNLKVFLKSL